MSHIAMFQWLRHRLAAGRRERRTAADWYTYYRSPQYFQGDLASAVTAALRERLCLTSDMSDLDVPPWLSILLATDPRDEVRCLAAIKMGLDKRIECEAALLAALHDDSETVRRTAALTLVALDTVPALAAAVAGGRHGHAVRTEAAHRLRRHGAEASEAIPALLTLLRYQDINWRSHIAAARALAAIGEPALPWLLHIFNHGTPHLRYYAAVALKEMNQTPELLTAIDEVLARNVREASLNP